MSNLQVLIIDDEPKVRQSMQLMLEKYCENVTIAGQAGSIDEAEKKIRTLRPNLLLLDVQMPHGTGFDLLNRFEQFDFQVIFITGHSQYAIKAFRYHAVDYLLKPVDIDEFVETISMVQQNIGQQENIKKLEQLVSELKQVHNNPITIPTQDGRSFISSNQIIRCQAEGAYTWIFLANKTQILSTKNLGEYERLLNPEAGNNSFFRIHHKHLINLNFLEGLQIKTHQVKMLYDTLLPIAQRRYSGFMEVLRQKKLV